MLLNEYMLGSGPKKITTPSKIVVPKVKKVPPKGKTSVPKGKTSASVKIKPVKVLPKSIFGTTFQPSGYKIKPLKRLPKNPLLSKTFRGAEDSKLKHLATLRGQLSPKVLQDREQCDIALGNVDCNGKNLCYICLSKLIPHTNVFDTCKATATITEWDLTTLPIVDENAGYYPQCEHIIACKTVSDDLNPWYMNFMMYKIHEKLLKAAGIVSQQNIPSIMTGYVLPTSTTDIKYLEYFLKIIIRMNYEWSHAICNNLKSNLEFAKYNAPNYEINIPLIEHVLNMLFEEGTNYFLKVEVNLGNHLTDKSNPYNIHRDKYTASQPNKTLIKSAAYQSIVLRVQFILDQLTYSRALNPGGKGYSKFNHRTIYFNHITQGGSNQKIFIEKINFKINEINRKQNVTKKLKNFETNINLDEIDIDFTSITIPDNDNEFIKFIENIHKIIFIEMLKKEANKDIKEFERKINSLNIFSFTDNILDYFIKLISKFNIDDYFFQEVILVFNDNLGDIEYNIKNLYDYIMLYKKNKLVKNAKLYDKIKQIENTKSYDLLIQLINLILYNPVEDAYIKKYADECENKIKSLNSKQLKSNYLKFLTLNNPDIQEKFKEMLLDIYDRTSQKTIKQHLFIIEFFQKILGNIIKDDIETEFYNICYIYFKLCINYGHLDKTSLNDRLNKIKVVDSFLKRISLSSEINQQDFKLLKGVGDYLSRITETSQEI
jgi:hypothetical protein